jgi:hypothetical protein
MKKFYTKYTPPFKISSPVGAATLTDSQFLADCDINVVMRRCASGDTSLNQPITGVFADVSDIGDFSTCMSKMLDARRNFEALPSAIRKRFGNDPALLISFLSDSANDEEAIRLGLKVKHETPPPVKVEVVGNPIIEATAEKGGQDGSNSNV